MPAPGVVTANLIVEHQFTGGGGSTVSDTSGNSNTLTLGVGGSAVLSGAGTSQVAPSWDALGLVFDNATNTIATWADGSIVTTSTETFSAELWVKVTTLTSLGTYFNFGYDDHILEDDSNTSFFWPSFITNYFHTGGASTGSKSIKVSTSGGSGFALNHWYQVAVTREPSTGKLTTFINGSHQHDNYGSAAAFETNGFGFTPSAPAGISNLRALGGDSFDGDGVSALIGELRFYTSVLSDADVLQNYNARVLAVTGSSPAPRKPSSGLSGGMKPLMNGGLNA